MLRFLVVPSLLVLGGCDAYTGSTPGESGRINFYEPNEYPGDESFSSQGFELSIAEGARVDVWMTSPGISSVTEVSIDRPDVLRIAGDVYPIQLRAESVGMARLRVEQNDGVSDTLPMVVTTPDEARVWVHEPTPPIAFGFRSPGNGDALRPGASVVIAGQPRAAGRPLLGFDLLEWSIDESLFTHASGGSEVNTQRLEALGVSGLATITTQFGGDVELRTLSVDDVVVLSIQTFVEGGMPVDATALRGQDATIFLLEGHDADGRHVVPSLQDQLDFSATIIEGSVELMDASLGGSVVEVRACAGIGRLELSFMGARLEVPIEVTEEMADEGCR